MHWHVGVTMLSCRQTLLWWSAISWVPWLGQRSTLWWPAALPPWQAPSWPRTLWWAWVPVICSQRPLCQHPPRWLWPSLPTQRPRSPGKQPKVWPTCQKGRYLSVESSQLVNGANTLFIWKDGTSMHQSLFLSNCRYTFRPFKNMWPVLIFELLVLFCKYWILS